MGLLKEIHEITSPLSVSQQQTVLAVTFRYISHSLTSLILVTLVLPHAIHSPTTLLVQEDCYQVQQE